MTFSKSTPAKVIIALLFSLVAVAIMSSCLSCKAKSGNSKPDDELSQPLVSTSSKAAEIGVRQDAILTNAKRLPTSNEKVDITEQAGLTKVAATAITAEQQLANKNMSLMAGSINNLSIEKAILQAKLNDLNTWIIGPRGWRWLTYGIIGFFSLGILSTVLGVGSPVGLGMILSRFINSNIFYPFVLIRDWINKRARGLTVAAVPTPVAESTKSDINRKQ